MRRPRPNNRPAVICANTTTGEQAASLFTLASGFARSCSPPRPKFEIRSSGETLMAGNVDQFAADAKLGKVRSRGGCFALICLDEDAGKTIYRCPVAQDAPAHARRRPRPRLSRFSFIVSEFAQSLGGAA